MGLVAAQRLRWGDGWLEPGEEVPENEPGRNYALMVESGQIESSGESGSARNPVAVAGDARMNTNDRRQPRASDSAPRKPTGEPATEPDVNPAGPGDPGEDDPPARPSRKRPARSRKRGEPATEPDVNPAGPGDPGEDDPPARPSRKRPARSRKSNG